MGDVTISEKFFSSDGQQYLKKPHLLRYFQQVKKKEYFSGFFPHIDTCLKRRIRTRKQKDKQKAAQLAISKVNFFSTSGLYHIASLVHMFAYNAVLYIFKHFHSWSKTHTNTQDRAANWNKD